MAVSPTFSVMSHAAVMAATSVSLMMLLSPATLGRVTFWMPIRTLTGLSGTIQSI